MSIDHRPAIRYHRVTTRRRTLRALQCPLDPELLVAEFAGELPPDVALAVREHIAVCETCGARSRTLRQPYELLAELGEEPVHYVPDLRDAVRRHAIQGRFARNLFHAASAVGRGGALAVASGLGALALIVALVLAMIFTASARTVQRSANRIAHPAAAAPSGTLYVQTDKLVAVTDQSGHVWQVAEVLAVRQQNGVVQRSLPASTQPLRTGAAHDLPRLTAVAPGGAYVVELLAGSPGYTLVAIDSTSGALRFVAPVRLPGGTPLPGGVSPVSLVFSPDGTTLYLGLTQPDPAGGGPRVLVVRGTDGAVVSDMGPALTSPIPMPPPPGGLPISGFPGAYPKLDLTTLPGVTAAEGASGALAISADGQWLFDLLTLTQGQTPSYGVIRRINIYTGQTVQELAIAGDFSLAQLVMSPNLTTPALIVAKGSPDAQAFVLDPGPTGPTLVGDAALGGPGAPEHTVFGGSLSASPSADGLHLYVAQDAYADNGLITGHDLWAVDLQLYSVLSHRLDPDEAGTVLANGVAAGGALTFILRQGQVLAIAPGLTGTATPWLVLDDGHPVERILASVP
jgi:anti-sigma factor RsiW